MIGWWRNGHIQLQGTITSEFAWMDLEKPCRIQAINCLVQYLFPRSDYCLEDPQVASQWSPFVLSNDVGGRPRLANRKQSRDTIPAVALAEREEKPWNMLGQQVCWLWFEPGTFSEYKPDAILYRHNNDQWFSNYMPRLNDPTWLSLKLYLQRPNAFTARCWTKHRANSSCILQFKEYT